MGFIYDLNSCMNDLRRWIMLLRESAEALVDREDVISKMLNSLNTGRFWNPYTKRKIVDDNIYDIWETFSHELPDEISRLGPDDGIETSEFQHILKRWVEARFAEVAQKLSRIQLVNGEFHVHRIMRVPRNWFKQVKAQGRASLGIYWTYDIEGWDEPSAVWAKRNLREDILIEALVASDYIDWTHTFLANMDWYSGDREYEMTIKSGSPIHVISIKGIEMGNGGNLIPLKDYDISRLVFTA